MSSVLEVLGLSLPYSASIPATYAEKKQECIKAAGYLKRLLELDLKPKYGAPTFTPVCLANRRVGTFSPATRS